MATKEARGSESNGKWESRLPDRQSMPVVFASPHSGADYPPEFVAASRLDSLTLRKSEDSFVDEIFAAAPDHGAPLLRAFFPRAFLDPNREPFELDPEMFEDQLPSYVNSQSARVMAGIGTIARVVTTGEIIYKNKLQFAEAADRIKTYYRPYHRELQKLIEQTRERFGLCLLIDCHSMPSVGGPIDQDPGAKRADFVLGDCYGASCAPELTDKAEQVLAGMGYQVARNSPYSGGYTTVNYGRPAAKVHALQIEINRALYMDETKIEPTPQMAELTERMGTLIAEFKDFALTMADRAQGE